MEELVNLRPKVLQKLLENCTLIKVKRFAGSYEGNVMARNASVILGEHFEEFVHEKINAG